MIYNNHRIHWTTSKSSFYLHSYFCTWPSIWCHCCSWISPWMTWKQRYLSRDLFWARPYSTLSSSFDTVNTIIYICCHSLFVTIRYSYAKTKNKCEDGNRDEKHQCMTSLTVEPVECNRKICLTEPKWENIWAFLSWYNLTSHVPITNTTFSVWKLSQCSICCYFAD